MIQLIQLRNKYLDIRISTLGAELRSISNQEINLEYIWQADPAFWNRSSPVLFPIVGKLSNNSYQYQQKNWSLSQHGFARDMEFVVEAQTQHSVTFLLNDSMETWKFFPFHFELEITYTLIDQSLLIDYKVKNTDSKELFFSIGAHPAFNIPFFKEEHFEDYFLTFNEGEVAERHVLKEGLITEETLPVFVNPNQLELTKELFYEDALVFKKLKSSTIQLLSKRHSHGLSMEAHDFPFYGIWSKKNADFICLEPWCGIADHEDSTNILESKIGINQLAPLEEFFRRITLRFF